jgi:hypothetical protein
VVVYIVPGTLYRCSSQLSTHAVHPWHGDQQVGWKKQLRAPVHAYKYSHSTRVLTVGRKRTSHGVAILSESSIRANKPLHAVKKVRRFTLVLTPTSRLTLIMRFDADYERAILLLPQTSTTLVHVIRRCASPPINLTHRKLSHIVFIGYVH